MCLPQQLAAIGSHLNFFDGQQHMFRLDFTIYSQLLEKEGIIPDRDFQDTGVLLYREKPDAAVRSRIRYILGVRVVFRPGEEVQLKRLQQFWRDHLSPEFEQDDTITKFQNEDQLRDIVSEAPVITLVNNIIDQAIDMNASDIHFEPDEQTFRVRCRVDGVLVNISELPVSSQAAVSSRLKLMANLDIGEKRLSQDGRIRFSGRRKTVDLRVSTLPGVYGESIVLRLLDRSEALVELSSLGMPSAVLAEYRKIISSPHGMILVTGPTGSGKTTTLYATLAEVYNEELKIVTVEDPVEYEFPGITQVHVKPKIGLTFASGLRSIVRQDPDIILIGEIRDQETAEIAVESSLTGHLVFSTLHTNDAASAVTRLQEMGIETYLISSSLLGILAQRLVRKNCPRCSVEHVVSEREKELLGLESAGEIRFRRGQGCEYCAGTGYRGRVGIYELLVVSDRIRQLIMEKATAQVIREQAVADGMTLLRQDGLAKLEEGITTPEEILRVARS